LIWGAHVEAAGSFGKSDSQSPNAAMPLNALVGLSLDQPFVLTIHKTAAAADELSKLSDVVLYLEYAATV